MRYAQPTSSQISGSFKVSDFHFDRAELAWFDKQVWSHWPAEAQEINRALRLGIEDLSMSRALEIDYHVETGIELAEKLTVHLRGDPLHKRLLMLELGSIVRLLGSPNLPEFGSFETAIWPKVVEWVRPLAGYKYGANHTETVVDFETMVYKLRQMLLAVQSHTQGFVIANDNVLAIFLKVTAGDQRWGAQITLSKPTYVRIPEELQPILEQARELKREIAEDHDRRREERERVSSSTHVHAEVQVAPASPPAAPVAKTRVLQGSEIYGLYERHTNEGYIVLYALNGKGVAVPVVGLGPDTYQVAGAGIAEAELLAEYRAKWGADEALPVTLKGGYHAAQ